MAADLACGRHADLVHELASLTARDPLRERLHEALMLALYRSGRQGEALAVYRKRFRRRLIEDLGIEPSASCVSCRSACCARTPRYSSRRELPGGWRLS